MVRDEVTVRAPAVLTGMGRGSLGLALELADTFTVKATTLASVSDDDFTRALFRGLESWGASLFRPEIVRGPRITVDRGLGEFCAHTVAGLVAAKAFLGDPPDFDIIALATEMGVARAHAVACLSGGAALEVISTQPARFIEPTLFIPNFSADIPGCIHGLSATVLMAGLLGGGGSEEELMAATEYETLAWEEEGAMPASLSLVQWLRDNGAPALLAGTGTAVVSLLPVSRPIAAAARQSGWQVVPTTTAVRGAQVL